MFGRRLPAPGKSEKLVRLYVESWKATFPNEHAIHKKIIKANKDLKAIDKSSPMASVERSNIMARVEEMLKDHPKLLLGFTALNRKRIISTPPEPRVSPPPLLTFVDAYLFMDSVEEAFYEEPAKYDEFLKILVTPHRADEASAIAEKLEELMKDHQELLQRFSLILSAESKRTIPVAPRNNKRKRAKPVGVRKSLRLIQQSKYDKV